MSTLNEQVAALGLPPMTDDELGRYLGLPAKQAAKVVAGIPADVRATYDHMHAVEVLNLLCRSGMHHATKASAMLERELAKNGEASLTQREDR